MRPVELPPRAMCTATLVGERCEKGYGHYVGPDKDSWHVLSATPTSSEVRWRERHSDGPRIWPRYYSEYAHEMGEEA